MNVAGAYDGFFQSDEIEGRIFGVTAFLEQDGRDVIGIIQCLPNGCWRDGNVEAVIEGESELSGTVEFGSVSLKPGTLTLSAEVFECLILGRYEVRGTDCDDSGRFKLGRLTPECTDESP